MTRPETNLGELWRRHWADVSPDRPGCLTPETWERLMSGAADTGERMRAATHVARCGACAEEYRLIQPLKSWADDAAPVFGGHRRAGAGRFGVTMPWLWQHRAALATAAAVALVVAQATVLYNTSIEHGHQTARLELQLAEHRSAWSSAQAEVSALGNQVRQRVDELSSPQIGVPIVDLEPREAGVVRGTERLPVVVAPAESQSVTLILHFAPLAARASLQLELADAQGQTRWVGRTDGSRDTGSVTLTLPRHAYPAGNYAIRVVDVTGGHRTLAEYHLTLREASSTSR